MTNPLLWLADFGILVCLWGLGILAVRFILPGSRLPEQVALGLGLGVGFLTWLLFIISWTGIPINLLTILITYFLLLAICILVNTTTCRKSLLSTSSQSANSEGLQGLLDIIGWVVFGVFSLALLIISIGLSYYHWDAMAIWSIKGYGIGMQQSISGAAEWGGKGLAYPLNIPLLISLFFSFDQDLLPGSKFIFPAFYIALLIGLIVCFRKQRLPAWLAWLAVFAIGTIPLLYQYSLMGYANIPYAYYYVMGIIWLGLGLNGKDARRTLIGALLLACSIWTRIEGLEFWPIVLISLAVVWKRELFEKRTILRILLPGLVVGGIWFLFSRLNHTSTGETVLLSEALSRMMHGELHPSAVYQILRFTAYLLIKTRGFGILTPMIICLSLLVFFIDATVRENKIILTMLISGVLSGLGVMFMYYLTSYDSSLDLSSWLGTGYDRMLFGTFLLLASASILILWKAVARQKSRQTRDIPSPS